VTDLHRLGLAPGQVVIVHTRMSAIGWVVGGSETVVRALLDVLGPTGTLVAYAGWQEQVNSPADWPEEHREAYLAEPPVFDAATGEAARDYGRIPERIRTWPGARRSVHPEASVVAIGARAGWLTAEHPADDGYGPGTPFARLVEADGYVLMLGAPLDTMTHLHHAEAIAEVENKRRLTYTVMVADEGGAPRERTYHDIDTCDGAFPYDLALGLGTEPFEAIASAALAAGIGVRGMVGAAPSHLFPAREVVAFARSWMEERFGPSHEAHN
jgi:aminoglycoside 3-N-acetyltransferase